MTTQPEALRLATELDAEIQRTVQVDMMHHNAAAELRQLHEQNEALKRRVEALNQALRQWLDKTEWIQETGRDSELGLHRADAVRQRLEQAEAQRDALLEKIKAVIAAEQSEGSGRGGFVNTPPTREHQRRVAQAWQELHAAIKAVEGEGA